LVSRRAALRHLLVSQIPSLLSLLNVQKSRLLHMHLSLIIGNRWSTLPPLPAHSPVPHTATLQHTPIRRSPRFLSPAITARPLGHTQVSAQSTAKSLPYVVCDEGSLARYKSSQHATSRVVTPSAPPMHAPPIGSVASLVVMKSTSSPLSQSLPLKSETKAIASLGTPMGPFVLASGQEVVFGRVADHWQASVQDMWGTLCRETTLPVICKGDLSAALHNLRGQGAVHQQKLIHILQTDQLPWAPSVVYVGAMGLKGGMEKEARQAQGQTHTVHASGKIDRVAVSGLQVHERSDKEQEDAARQAEKIRISSERRRQKIVPMLPVDWPASGIFARLIMTTKSIHRGEQKSRMSKACHPTSQLLPGTLPLSPEQRLRQCYPIYCQIIHKVQAKRYCWATPQRRVSL